MSSPVNRSSTAPSVGARLLLILLRGYQRVLSPLFAGLGAQCRFAPSCSQYMIDAVQARGAWLGLGLGVWRLLRCNPLNRGGYDPAPVHANGSRLNPTGQPNQDVSRETI